MSDNTVWRPQPRQAEFMARTEYEVLYGGAAGGGKSDALLAEALRQVDVPHYRGLILRKTFPQAAELIDRSRAIYKPAFPEAVYTSGDHCWSFPSGARVMFGSMQRAGDKTHYQGQSYDYIAFDELTHFTWDEYSYMFSRNRPSGPGTRVYIRAATNPGGVGHGWVKERFITAGPALTPIVSEVEVPSVNGGIVRLRRERVFVPSTVFDNAALLRNDPEYAAKLAMLPEAEKRALLYGQWDSFDGQVFSEWRNDPSHYDDRLYTHVIRPFAIPSHWRVYRGFDFGYARPYSVGWYAADEERRLYRVAELYGCAGSPNVGVMQNPAEIARRIKEMEDGHPLLSGKNVIGVADPSIFDASRTESVAAMMARFPNRIYFGPGDNARIAGKMQFHYRLAFGDDGRPMFYCFDTCRHFIRTVPSLVYDRCTVEDVDSSQEDHAYDECRYVMMENPITPRKCANPIAQANGPLDSEQVKDRYRFYRI